MSVALHSDYFGPFWKISMVTAYPLSNLPDVTIIEPKRHKDTRGFFSEVWNARDFAAIGVDAAFVQHNHARSEVAGTLRGFHYQAPPHAQGKLVRVIQGEIFDVVVDIRRGSPTFGRWASIELSAENWRQIWVPEGFAHAYYTCVPGTEVIYSTTRYYAPEHEFGLAWDDPELSVSWPFDKHAVVLSERDRHWPKLAELQTHFGYDDQVGLRPASPSR